MSSLTLSKGSCFTEAVPFSCVTYGTLQLVFSVLSSERRTSTFWGHQAFIWGQLLYWNKHFIVFEIILGKTVKVDALSLKNVGFWVSSKIIGQFYKTSPKSWSSRLSCSSWRQAKNAGADQVRFFSWLWEGFSWDPSLLLRSCVPVLIW